MTQTTSGASAPSIRLFSDQLMLELQQRMLAQGLLNRDQVEELNERSRLTGENLDRLIIKEGLVPETVVLQTLSEITGIPFRPVADFNVTPVTASRLPARAAFRYKAVPVEIAGGTMRVAVSQVPDLSAVDSLSMLLGMALEWVLCTEADIAKSLKHFHGLGLEAVDAMIQSKTEETVDVQETDLTVETTDPGVVKFVNQVIHEAIKMDATDIHVEPFEDHLRLRYRIDGVLQDIPVPKGIQKLKRAISSCVKIMAQMNIAERRKPHDGRINVRIDAEEFDLRISVLPTRFGETVVMRILNRKSMFIDMEHLGLTGERLKTLQALSDLPHGIILLTGPTGSGKTTTLYALLSRLNTSEVKIITVEDPVEYQMDGISQIQVHAQIDLTFANILRSILRHDPDIILIGEIRDSETADIAVRSALTGHLVFSTLHTNDAPSAIMRLSDMGIEPYLVSSCLEGIVAQRLVRKLCLACREESPPNEVILEEIRELFPDRFKNARFFKARGCPHCNFTGYRGRVAIFEIMVMDEQIRSMVVRQRPSNEIRRVAAQRGLTSLRQDGLSKVLDGLTTADEVIRVARKFDVASH